MSETEQAAPTCANCVFVRKSGLTDLECRRIPPSAHPIMTQGLSGPTMSRASFHPPVQATGWCGEHVRKIELAA